ncbi:MAG: rRNA maturation RNase YbeY [Planctomycetes bacterium]|nr:rRNA maturation RNase YbeY [Planctomycetota bacterium]
MIEVSVLSKLRQTHDHRLIRRAVHAALSGRLGRASVTVLLVGAARMRSLNRDALGHDYVTDVLCFDYGDSPEGRLCEIVVCPEYAGRQARAYAVPAAQELARYVVHGCLHCAGFDDSNAPKRARMWSAQEAVLRAMFGKRYVAQPD